MESQQDMEFGGQETPPMFNQTDLNTNCEQNRRLYWQVIAKSKQQARNGNLHRGPAPPSRMPGPRQRGLDRQTGGH